jgi:hypothetical protein
MGVNNGVINATDNFKNAQTQNNSDISKNHKILLKYIIIFIISFILAKSNLSLKLKFLRL